MIMRRLATSEGYKDPGNGKKSDSHAEVYDGVNRPSKSGSGTAPVRHPGTDIPPLSPRRLSKSTRQLPQGSSGLGAIIGLCGRPAYSPCGRHALSTVSAMDG